MDGNCLASCSVGWSLQVGAGPGVFDRPNHRKRNKVRRGTWWRELIGGLVSNLTRNMQGQQWLDPVTCYGVSLAGHMPRRYFGSLCHGIHLSELLHHTPLVPPSFSPKKVRATLRSLTIVKPYTKYQISKRNEDCRHHIFSAPCMTRRLTFAKR